MNSLEWINAEIIKWQEILESFKEQLIQVKGTRNEQTTLNHIEFYELKLQYLHQIKAELEAWYVVKEELQITVKSKNPYGEPLRRYELNVIGQNKIDTLNKALEVEDEKEIIRRKEE